MFTNHSSLDLELAVTIIFDCDFADIFEARGMRREKRGTLARSPQSAQSVGFAYVGLDGIMRRTMVHVEPEPVSVRETAALYYLHLAPKGSAESEIAKPACSYVKGLRDAQRSMRRAEVQSTGIDVADPSLVLKRGLSDLRVLTTQTDDGPYPYAGTPWYSTTFGRDALISAWQLLWLDVTIARGVC
jgi:glycogen debranching enzyme